MIDPFDTLAQYNAEVARGIMHTEEWKLKMAQLQDQWGQMQIGLTNSQLGTGAYREIAIPNGPWWRLW